MTNVYDEGRIHSSGRRRFYKPLESDVLARGVCEFAESLHLYHSVLLNALLRIPLASCLKEVDIFAYRHLLSWVFSILFHSVSIAKVQLSIALTDRHFTRDLNPSLKRRLVLGDSFFDRARHEWIHFFFAAAQSGHGIVWYSLGIKAKSLTLHRFN